MPLTVMARRHLLVVVALLAASGIATGGFPAVLLLMD